MSERQAIEARIARLRTRRDAIATAVDEWLGRLRESGEGPPQQLMDELAGYQEELSSAAAEAEIGEVSSIHRLEEVLSAAERRDRIARLREMAALQTDEPDYEPYFQELRQRMQAEFHALEQQPDDVPASPLENLAVDLERLTSTAAEADRQSTAGGAAAGSGTPRFRLTPGVR